MLAKTFSDHVTKLAMLESYAFRIILAQGLLHNVVFYSSKLFDWEINHKRLYQLILFFKKFRTVLVVKLTYSCLGVSYTIFVCGFSQF